MTGESTKLPERLGIAGSGAIACGLARAAGERGEVLLWARSEASAERVRPKLDGAVEVTTDLAVLGSASAVVEAVVEDARVKRELLGRLGELVPADTILATTTSSLAVAELAESSGRPERFAGLHVFNPVEKMRLVELAFHDSASQDTRARTRELCLALGKTPVEVPDTPGFVVNRLLFPYLFDAVRLLEESGLAPEDVDECMTLGAGHPMGPLRLLDFVGLDTSAAIGRSIGADVPARLLSLVADGQLGRKSGSGFYSYG